MKYCCSCGTALPDSAAFCCACGKAVDPPVVRPTAPAAPAAEPPAAAPVTPPAAPPTVVYEQPVVQPPQQAPRSSIVFPIVSLAAAVFGLLVTLIALGVSYSMVEMLPFALLMAGNFVVSLVFAKKARGGRLRGLALAGKIISIVGLALVGLVLLVSVSEVTTDPDFYNDIFNT